MQHNRVRQVLAFLAVAALALVAPAVAEAQTGKISGVVADAATGQPIEGVQVVLLGTGFGGVTQANGRYFIISVPPGTYTVVARRIGYQSAEVAGVQVRIDVTREVNFQLNSATQTLTAVRTIAPPTPLIEQGLTGSGIQIPTEIIEALPVTNVAGVLSLQQGFLEVPQNTDIVAFTETRRNAVSAVRVRGGRGGSTVTLIDGIPANNILFGTPTFFNLNTYAVQQLDFQRGYMEPQYGNALSGLINIATKEGGRTLAGNLDYQTTGLAGGLGSTPDDLAAYNIYRGFLAGPVPSTAEKLRFALGGQLETGADRVFQFDEDTRDFDDFNRNETAPIVPEEIDVIPGWRAGGFNNVRELFGKVTYNMTQSSKLNLTLIDAERQRQVFDPDYVLVGFDPLSQRGVNSMIDTLALLTRRNYRDVVQNSIRAEARLLSGSFEQRFDRTNLQLRAARLEQARESCNFFQGICLGPMFADINFEGRFVAPGITENHPTVGTDEFFGGEDVVSHVLRGDIQSQVTDHHNLQGGLFFQQHDIVFDEVRNRGTSDIFVVPEIYRAKPYEFAAYAQDRIEYDFLTVKLGFRFDYGKAQGRGFVDPLRPTNGTSAREVCNGEAPSLGFTSPFTIVDSLGTTRTGLAACTYGGQPKIGTRTVLLDSATRAAARDDFEEAEPRTAFSPRIGVSFPMSETSTLFFNAGRYTMNPLYHTLYNSTGVGTRAGAADNVCAETERKPGTSECVPILGSDVFTTAFIGNPNLLLEQSTMYEIGYAAELGREYAVQFTVYNRDETGLSGARRSRADPDVGTTYGNESVPNYLVIVNQDYMTARGIEVQFRRRLANFWGYDLNYSFSHSTTNAPPPDRAQQSLEEGDSTVFREIKSEIDQPHVFNGALFFSVDDRVPEFRFANLLRNSNLTLTARAASGFPYTPTDNFSGFDNATGGGAGDVNSARAPSTFVMDLFASKDFQVANVNYGAFVRVQNLLDTKNCIQVYVTTGRCDTGTIDQRRARHGNTVGATSSTTFFDRPNFYGARRQIFTGVRASF